MTRASTVDIRLRQENPSDHSAIATMIVAAYRDVGYSDHREPFMVERLRGSDAFIPRLSLVAEVGHKIVGHVMLTEILIRNGESSSVSLALAPLSVAPEFQGIGVGRRLVYEAHRIAKAMGYPSITVLGPAKYYSRFGYETMQSHGIEVPFDVKDENCMIIILDDQRSSGVTGRIEYSSAFLE